MFDTAADIAAGAVILNLKYTDDATSRTISTSPVVLTSTSGLVQGNIMVELASGNLTYGVTHTGIFATASYALYIALLRLN